MRRDLRVCFAGDSYVAGVGDRTSLGWVGRVATEAAGQGLPLTTYNLGVRGDTGGDIATRLPAELLPRLHTATEPRVIISFGVNDTAIRDGIVRSTTDQSVQALRNIHHDVTAPILVVGPPAVDDDAQNERLATLNERLAAVAAELRMPFVETFTATASASLWKQQVRDGDGYHPDAEAYALLASFVAPAIIDWLRIKV